MVCPSTKKRSWMGLGARVTGSGKEAGLPLGCRYFFNPFNNDKNPSTRKPGSSRAGPDALVSLSHIPNRLEIHRKTQHILDDSLTLVKFSSKISL